MIRITVKLELIGPCCVQLLFQHTIEHSVGIFCSWEVNKANSSPDRNFIGYCMVEALKNMHTVRIEPRAAQDDYILL